MSKSTRRQFLKNAAVVTASTCAIGAGSRRILGANERICIGVAGINGQGGSHINSWLKRDGGEVGYLIDPDSRLFARRAADIEKAGGRKPTCVQDIRKALEDKGLDAISIASCNHWHCLLTIWACQAGKDVYVEKPLSHNVHEGGSRWRRRGSISGLFSMGRVRAALATGSRRWQRRGRTASC